MSSQKNPSPNLISPPILEFHHIDLTAFIKNLAIEPMILGGLSDSYLGDLIVSNGSRKAVVKVSRTLTCGRYDLSRAIKLLNQEVSILSRLVHPNIAEYLGVTYHVGQHPAIVTAWYPRGDAPTFLTGRPVNERLHLIKGVIEGLCYLHSRSPAIAHGNIKGVNILVNEFHEGVLSNFGLSRVIEGGARPSGDPADSPSAYGTTRWMARELFHEELGALLTVGPTLPSDVWAFGCTFYQLMLGMIPYSSRQRFPSIIRDIVSEILPFSEVDATRIGSNEMWVVVKQCWSPAPGD